MRVNILESGGLTKPSELIVDKAILNSVKFLHIIRNCPACFSYKCLYNSVSGDRHPERDRERYRYPERERERERGVPEHSITNFNGDGVSTHTLKNVM